MLRRQSSAKRRSIAVRVSEIPQRPPAPPAPPTAPAPAPLAILARSLVPGDIVWILLPNSHVVGSEQKKQRPWLVISPKRFNEGPLGLLIGVPLSKSQRILKSLAPGRVLVESNQITYADQHLPENLKLLRTKRIALCDQVRALSEQRVIAKPGQAQRKVYDDVRAGIAFNIEL